MKKIIFAVLAALSFLSCETFIDMEIPNEGRKITINSMINDQENPVVYLHRSRFILDATYEFEPIIQATVTLSKEGAVVATLHETELGVYTTSDYIPEKGYQYTIEVIKGGETATAQTFIPNIIGCQFIDTVRITKINMDQHSEFLRFNLRVNDPGDQENYYMVTFFHQLYDYPMSFYNAQQIVENGNDSYLNYAVFSDKLINGMSKTLSFDIDINNFIEEVNPMRIQFNSISKDMYLYYLRLSTYWNARNSFLAEPVMMYTNINNGLGIFAGYSNYSINFVVPKLAEGWIWEGEK
jgi:hypothetical protein